MNSINQIVVTIRVKSHTTFAHRVMGCIEAVLPDYTGTLSEVVAILVLLREIGCIDYIKECRNLRQNHYVVELSMDYSHGLWRDWDKVTRMMDEKVRTAEDYSSVNSVSDIHNIILAVNDVWFSKRLVCSCNLIKQSEHDRVARYLATQVALIHRELDDLSEYEDDPLTSLKRLQHFLTKRLQSISDKIDSSGAIINKLNSEN